MRTVNDADPNDDKHHVGVASPETEKSPGHHQPDNNRTIVLAIILISYVLIVLNISIVITGLPKIRDELGFSTTGLSWVANAYTLAFGGFLLLGARAGDILGHRRMLVIGLAIFVFASLAIGLALSPAWLIGARALQGLGSAILAPPTLALLQTNFPAGPERARAVAYYAAAAGVSASVGLVLGGILADWISWRAGFFVNLPIGVGLIIGARRFIAETETVSGALDFAGALFSTVGMSALVFGAIHSASAGWTDPVTVFAFLGGVILLVAFVGIEAHAKQPIMPLRLLASLERASANLIRVLFLGANVGFFYFTSLFMQGVLHYSPTQTGLAFFPSMVVSFVIALTTPRLMRRAGTVSVLIASIILSLAGMIWLSQISSDTTYWLGLAIPMLLIGAGQGGAMAPLTMFGIAGVESRDVGAASGVVNVAHQLGSSLGFSFLVAASAIGSVSLNGSQLLTHQIDYAMAAGAVLLILALGLTTVIISQASSTKNRNR